MGARIRAFGREFLANLDKMASPPKPVWLTTWYWLDRWDDWRERTAK